MMMMVTSPGVDGSALLDVRHLPDAGHRVQHRGQAGPGAGLPAPSWHLRGDIRFYSTL